VNDDRRMDLGPLDPERDVARLDRAARAVAMRVAPLLAARRERPADAWGLLESWRRPVLAAAALVAVASLVTIVRVPKTVSRATGDARVSAIPQAASPTSAAAGSASAGATASAPAEPGPSTDTGRASLSLSEAAGIPAAYASWVESGAPPAPSHTFDVGGQP
jgi:hypothetical protein